VAANAAGTNGPPMAASVRMPSAPRLNAPRRLITGQSSRRSAREGAQPHPSTPLFGSAVSPVLWRTTFTLATPVTGRAFCTIGYAGRRRSALPLRQDLDREPPWKASTRSFQRRTGVGSVFPCLPASHASPGTYRSKSPMSRARTDAASQRTSRRILNARPQRASHPAQSLAVQWGSMKSRVDGQPRAGIPVVLLRLATSVLLLFALSAMILNVHHGEGSGSADPGAITVVAFDGGQGLYTASADSQSDRLLGGVATVCVFILICFLLRAAVFSERFGGRRLLAAVSPRGSPARVRPLGRSTWHPSLSQLSISRT